MAAGANIGSPLLDNIQLGKVVNFHSINHKLYNVELRLLKWSFKSWSTTFRSSLCQPRWPPCPPHSQVPTRGGAGRVEHRRHLPSTRCRRVLAATPGWESLVLRRWRSTVGRQRRLRHHGEGSLNPPLQSENLDFRGRYSQKVTKLETANFSH